MIYEGFAGPALHPPKKLFEKSFFGIFKNFMGNGYWLKGKARTMFFGYCRKLVGPLPANARHQFAEQIDSVPLPTLSTPIDLPVGRESKKACLILHFAFFILHFSGPFPIRSAERDGYVLAIE